MISYILYLFYRCIIHRTTKFDYVDFNVLFRYAVALVKDNFTGNHTIKLFIFNHVIGGLGGRSILWIARIVSVQLTFLLALCYIISRWRQTAEARFGRQLRDTIGIGHCGVSIFFCPVYTLDFLGLWENLHNLAFKLLEFEGVGIASGENAFAISPNLSKWLRIRTIP